MRCKLVVDMRKIRKKCRKGFKGCTKRKIYGSC